jgi:hypothetical protein
MYVLPLYIIAETGFNKETVSVFLARKTGGVAACGVQRGDVLWYIVIINSQEHAA